MNRIGIKILLVVFFVSGVVPLSVFTYSKNVAAQSLAVPTAEIPLSPLSTNTLTTSINTGLTNNLIGMPGTTQAALTTIRGAVGATCQGIITALDAGTSAESLIESAGSAALSVIGGGTGESAKLSQKIVRAVAAKECVDGYVTAVSAFSPPTVLISQDLQREQDKFTKVSESLRVIIEDLQARQSASVKDIMRAFMVKLVLNLNKNLTTKVVNEMVQKYKIDDYLAYGDALATQVYAMKYIDQNYEGDARTQMMMRSLIQSEKVPQKARVAAAFANQQAKEHIKSQCGDVGTLDAYNASSLSCLAAYGNEQSSPLYKYLNALDTSEKIKAEAVKTAQAEISQSDGYAPPRDCGGSVDQQTQLDSKIENAAKERDAAERVFIQMKESFGEGRTTQAELDKAQAAYEAAEQKLSNLPAEVNDPVIDICKAIDSPAKFVANSVQDYLKQHLDQGSQLKSDNLPFYANFLADLTGNFLTNLLTGGKSTSKVFKEAGVQALGLGITSAPAIIGGVVGSSGSSLPKEYGNPWMTVYMTAVGSNDKIDEVTPGRQYTFHVDISGHIRDGRERPNRIVIRDRDTGEAIVNTTVGAENVMRFNFTALNRTVKWEVEISVRDGDGARILETVTGAYFVKGAVAGVQTVSFNPRGASPSFQPR